LKLVVIRGKINAALSLPETEIPDDDPLRVLLAIPHPNFFHVRQIVEILAKTEKEKKNFIGQCTSSILNAWSDILRTYQKNGCYLAESAQQLIRYVNYEITALKKAIDKNKKMVKECERKEAEYASQVSQTMEVYKR
jgi:predicted ribosome quality control (RQC) complex YloA/Tae2 family protein